MNNSLQKNFYYEFDTPILLTFFVRSETLIRVFEQIRKVKPKVLFLASDGPRNGHTDDQKKINECREIVSKIDWECDVFRYYADKNLGILANTSQARNRAFQIVDRLIFLEDDVLPNVSFFYFCQEMLNLYETDDRISIISGANPYRIDHLVSEEYFFVKHVTSGATAWWKTTEVLLEKLRAEIVESGGIPNSKSLMIPKKFRNSIIRKTKKQIFFKKSSYFSDELLRLIHFYISNKLGVMPKTNLVSSISVSNDSAHSYDDIRKLPKALRSLQQHPTNEMEFPIREYPYVVENVLARDRIYRILAIGYPFAQISRWIVTSILILIHGSPRELFYKILKWIKFNFTKDVNPNG
jgi:hypothetical protein